MTESYSRGFYAEVLRPKGEERIHFPQADLVRKESSRDRHWFARLYYRHKIASLLFPDNFITVVGASRLQQVSRGEDSLYSKEANAGLDHAVFSAHMRQVDHEVNGRIVRSDKGSTCECMACTRHRIEHLEMQNEALEFSRQLLPVGLRLDDKDPSDYCLVNGKLVFFEIEDLDPAALRNYLTSLRSATVDKQTVFDYVKRYQKLRGQSFLDSFEGSGYSVRLG